MGTMKANFTNSGNKMSVYNAQHLRHNKAGVDASNQKENNVTRPAQAISFRGSALSMGQKFIDAGPVNKVIGFVSENEAAYTAIYSLLIAGVLKPACVLAQTGSDDKDGQMIATKNFLQAFLGSFLGLTIGGGFVKKIWDNIKSNLSLFDIDENKNLSVLDETSKKARDIAKKLVVKEHTGIGSKFSRAKSMVENADGLKKVPAFFNGMFSKMSYKPTKEEISAKAKEYVANFNANHKEILEKNPEFLKELVADMKELELHPSTAKENIKEGFKSNIFSSFESFWKNSTGAATSIFKAKIASFLLPTVMAFMFAKRNLENQRAKDEATSQKTSDILMNNSKALKDGKNKFAAVSGGVKEDNGVAFKGSILDKAVDISTRGIEHAAMSKPGEKLAYTLAKFKKPSARMADLESIGITAYWVGSTAMSKRIDPDQKLGLNVHSVLVTAISSTAAFLLDALTDGFVTSSETAYLDRVKETAKGAKEKLKAGATDEEIKKFVKKNTSNLFDSKKVMETLTDKEILNLEPKKLASELENLSAAYSKKLSKFKSLTIFTLVVRFLVPVLTVKMSKKIKNKIIDWTKQRRIEKENKAKAAQDSKTVKTEK